MLLECLEIALRIHHSTTYHYREPVVFQPHRLLLRPRESRNLRLISSELSITPEATVTWAEDIHGSAVATATFHTAADMLRIDSNVHLELHASAWPVFDVAASATSYPFRYADHERIDLGALAIQQHPDSAGRLRAWVRAFVRGSRTDTLALLKDLSAGISTWISYQSRHDEGTQIPLQTLDPRWGSCRDFAVLFAEAARLGAGWITFDPTNQPQHSSLSPSLATSLRPCQSQAVSWGCRMHSALTVNVSVTASAAMV